MPRVKCGVTTKKRHKKILKLTKGYYGRSKNCYRISHNAGQRGLKHAYNHRKELKSEMRSLWIIRINAASRALGMKYNEFMHKLSKHDINLNRKMLSELAIRKPEKFEQLLKLVSSD